MTGISSRRFRSHGNSLKATAPRSLSLLSSITVGSAR